MAETDIDTLHTTALQNTRALEQQGLQQIEQRLAGLGQCPQHRSALEARKQIDVKHMERLDEALEAADGGKSGLVEGVMSVAGEIGAAVRATASDETPKNPYAGDARQFDRIAAYQSLAVMAEEAGHASSFRVSLKEDEASADVIDGMIGAITRRYPNLATGGRKADS